MTIPPFLLWPTVIEQLYYWTRIREHWSAGRGRKLFIRVHLFLVVTFPRVISLTCKCHDTQHFAPVAREHIPGREVRVGPAALGVGLHVEHGEHAPVGQVDDAAHSRPWAGPWPRSGYRGFLMRRLMSITWTSRSSWCPAPRTGLGRGRTARARAASNWNWKVSCTVCNCAVCLYKSILFQSPFSEKLNDQSCVSYTV